MANKKAGRSRGKRERARLRSRKKSSGRKSAPASLHVRGASPVSSKTKGISTGGLIYSGFHKKANRMATLTEVQDPRVPTRTIGELSHSEMQRLVCSRIKNDESFTPLHMLGIDGVVDKDRALREVRTGSHIGLHLIEIEKEYIALQLARRSDGK